MNPAGVVITWNEILLLTTELVAYPHQKIKSEKKSDEVTFV